MDGGSNWRSVTSAHNLVCALSYRSSTRLWLDELKLHKVSGVRLDASSRSLSVEKQCCVLFNKQRLSLAGQRHSIMRPFIKRVAQNHLPIRGSSTRPHGLLCTPKAPLIQQNIPENSRRLQTDSKSPQNQPSQPGPSRLESKAHSLGWESIQAKVEPYFSEKWNFSSEKEKQAFLSLGLSRAFSCFFPLTLEDRVEATCRMHYLALLIDG